MPVFPGRQRTRALRKLWEMPEVKKLVRWYGFFMKDFHPQLQGTHTWSFWLLQNLIQKQAKQPQLQNY